MHLKNLLFVSLCLALFVACGGGEKSNAVDAGDAGDAAAANSSSVSYTVNTAQSELAWSGSKITGDAHNGTIAISSGSMSVDGEKLTAGEFVVDMNSIQDLSVENAEYKGKLEGHLKSPDFFDTATHPTARFEVTAVQAVADNPDMTHQISGNLTIKGITKEITIPAKVSMNGNSIAALANFAVNRADFDVRYGSGSFFEDLGDDLINDDINFSLKVFATKS